MRLAVARELFKHIFKKPFTLKYPFEKKTPFKGLRGRPAWNLERCIGCGLCYRDCPSGAIEMIGKGSKAEFRHHLDLCLFCAQCEESCPRGAITMTEEYELAGFDSANMIVEFKRTELHEK